MRAGPRPLVARHRTRGMEQHAKPGSVHRAFSPAEIHPPERTGAVHGRDDPTRYLNEEWNW